MPDSAGRGRSSGSPWETATRRVVLAGIAAYKVALAFFWGGACRYVPSCSDYAVEAVHTHGAWRGIRLAARRVGRCHPWGGYGHDPVPPMSNFSN